MRNRLPLIVGLLAVVGAIVLVGWLRRPDDKSAPTTSSGAVATATAKPGQRPPPAPASVAGRVTRKADGAGVAGAIVSIARAELGANLSSTTVPTVVVTTDANGVWEAKNVKPGDFMIAATAKGFLPSAKEKLTIASGEQRTGVDIALEPGGSLVKGTVSDVGGGPIGAARVTAQRDEWSLNAGAEFVTLTGQDGTYELALPDGAYRLHAEHDDYTRDAERAEVAGKPLTVDFTLIPGAVIHGQVIARDTRKPVASAMVSAAGGRGRRSRDTTVIADDEGRFVLRGLTSGAIAITAKGRGYASASPSTVQVGIGEQVEDVQVLVDGAFSIIGRVVKKGTKEGITGARLGAFSMTGGGGEALAPTDETGAFEIPGLRPGSYMLFAAAEKKLLEIGKNHEITDHDLTDVIVELSSGVTISGRVEPPGVATVGLETEGEVGLANMFEMVKVMMVRAESDASGAFTLDSVPPGKFKIVASTKAGSKGTLPVTIEAVDQTGLVVQMTKRASIAGRVIDTNGKPVAGMNVEADADDERKGMRLSSMMMDRGNVESAADGSYKIVGLDAGKYEVRVRDFEAMMKKRDKDRKKLIVELAEGAEKTGVTLTVEARDGVIRGVVIGADGKPTGDAWVTAQGEADKLPDMPEEVSRRLGRSQSEPVLTGGDGKFVITKLRKGKYTLVAEGPRGSSRGEKPGINVGETTQIQLASLGTLVVTVTQRGAPTKSYDIDCGSPAHDVERHAQSEDGTYKLENLPPGEYKCNVTADSGTAEGKVTVPSSEAKLALSLSMFGSLSGTVVSVLTAKPIAELDVIANTEGGKGFLEAMTGKGIKTDAQGRFVVERVPAGKGKLMFAGKAGFSSMESHDYVAKEGERVDLGAIKIVPPRTTEAGTFGFSLEPKDDALEVTNVTPGSPAEGAGIVVGDKLTTVETIPVKTIGIEMVKKLLSSGTVGIGQTVRLGLEKGSIVSVTSVKW